MSFDDLLEELEALELLLRSTREKKRLEHRLLEIYKFRTIASPEDKNWKKRVKEEEYAFWALKQSRYGDILPHFLSLKPSSQNKQYFYVIYKGEKIAPAIIKVPRLYPELPPNSLITIDKTFEIFTSHTDPNKCLGNLVKGRWDESGRMGVAHWLLFIEVYIVLTNNPVRLNKLKNRLRYF